MTTNIDKYSRVIDANLNRLREGIRVIEDYARYLYDNKELASSLKEIRHLSRVDNASNILSYRDAINDVLKKSTESEMSRCDIEDLITANFKRAQESSRVLEETYKLILPEISQQFKHIRYSLYTVEKEFYTFINSTSNSK